VQAWKKPRAFSGFSRRKFFAGLGVSMAASFLPYSHAGILASPRSLFFQRSNGRHEVDLLYPPVDLSYFETPIGQRI
jgi:hypothetical protein